MMIAMVIMLVALTSVLLVSFGTQGFLIGGETNHEAVIKAQENLETAQAFARKDFKLVNPMATVTDGIYKKWTSVSISSSTDFFTKKITSYVSWTDEKKIQKNVELTALISNFKNAVGGDTCNSFLTGNWNAPAKYTFSLASLIGDSSGTYTLTDFDVYQGRLYATTNNSSQTLGPTNPQVATDATGVGTGSVSWTNVNNIKASDNNRASATISGSNITHYVKASGFGFAIPAGATILGIKVEVEKSVNSGGSGSVLDAQVKIVKSDGTVGSLDKSSGSSWPSVSSETYTNYGGIADLWGEIWTPSDINSSNFGVVIAAKGSSANRTANIDHVRISITYIKDFYVFNISNPASPTFVGGLGSNPAVSAGFNAVATDGTFAYVATNAGPASGQLQIIAATATPFQTKATFIVPGVTGTGAQALGSSIFYSNGYVYLGLTKTATGPEFNIVDVHNPYNPTLLGSYSLGNGINSIFVRGNYAYLGTDNNSRELAVLDISNPASPSLLGSGYNATPDTSGFGYGRSIYAVGDTLYLGRTYITNAPEFNILNVTNPSSIPSTPLGSYDSGPNATNPFSINGLIVRHYLAFVLLGSATKGGSLQILSVGTPASTTLSTSVSIPNGTAGIGGVSLDCEGNYIYAGSVDTNGNSFLTIVTGQ